MKIQDTRIFYVCHSKSNGPVYQIDYWQNIAYTDDEYLARAINIFSSQTPLQNELQFIPTVHAF